MVATLSHSFAYLSAHGASMTMRWNLPRTERCIQWEAYPPKQGRSCRDYVVTLWFVEVVASLPGSAGRQRGASS